MKRSKFILIFILFLSIQYSEMYGQTHTINHNIYYETYNQNMWGPNGSPFSLNVHVDLFDFDYDTAFSLGWMDTILGVPFGAMFNFDTWFHLGSDFEMYGWTTGWVDVVYPVNLELTIPDDYTFNPGEVVTINSEYTVLPGAEITSHFPQAGIMSLDLDFGFDLELDVDVCLVGCDNFPIMDISVPLDSIPIFYINGQTGQAIYPCLQNGLPAFCNTYVLPITFNNLFGMGLSGWITLPYIETTSHLNTADACHKNLYAEGDSTYLYLELDVVQFLSFVAGLIPPPQGPAIQQFLNMLHGTYDLGGGIYVEYNLFTALFEITNTMQQDLNFKPFIYTILSFPTDVEYFVSDPDNGNQIIEQGLADTVQFKTCYDFNYRYPCFGWPQMEIGHAAHLDNEFTNHVWDSLAFVFSIEALEFTFVIPFPFVKSYTIPSLCIEGTDENGEQIIFCLPEITNDEFYPDLPMNDSIVTIDTTSKNGSKYSWHIGPLIDYDIPLGYIPITWFDETWELDGFDTDTVFLPFIMIPGPEFVMNTTFSNNLCANDSVASINVTVTNGTPPYIYSWSNGVIDTSYSTTNTQSGLLSGTYSVTASDINGCSFTQTFTIQDINPPIYINLNPTNVLCHGFSTGSISTAVSGGTPGYTYTWSPSGGNTQNPNNLPAGTYTVTVIDNVGCPQVESVTISEPATYVEITSDSVENVHCYGGNNGYIGINVDGGSPGYTYYWNNLSQQQDVNNLHAGTFTVTVTDSHGCTLTFTQIISQPPQLTASLMSTDATCYGLNNGNIDLSPGGGTPPYSYIWNNGATTQDLTQIPFGAYQVTISDYYSCSTVTSVYIAQPSLPVMANFEITNVRCAGDSTGAIDMSVWGGTPPYSYVWNNGQTTPVIFALFAGNYVVTITDYNSCDTVIYVNIPEGSPLHVTAQATAPSCYGYCDGSALAFVSTEGVPPYSYSWSTGSTASYINGLCVGLYILSVTDNNMCTQVAYFVVPQPVPLLSNITTPGIPCYGGTANVTVNITSGNPPYSYLWSDGSASSTFVNATSGEYEIIITDSHNCSDTIIYNLTQPGQLVPDTLITHVRCALLCNGKIHMQPYGGTPPYSFMWSNGIGLSDIADLCKGIYPITITDSHNCTSSANVEVKDLNLSPPVNATANDSTLYIGQTTTLGAYSSANIYTYQWSPTSTITGSAMQHPVASPETTTTYYVTVTDYFGCKSVDSVIITVLDVICSEPYIFIPNAFSPNNDGENDILYVYAPMARDIYLAVYTRWGELVFVSDNIQEGWDGTFKGEIMNPDVFVYYVKVTCENNMIFEKSGNITLLR